MSESLFVYDGDHVVATDLARGPWDQRFLHGGPVTALLAGAVESAETGGTEFHVARLTVELERPVPAAVPMRIVTEVTRPGRKVQLVDTQLLVDGTVVARARGMRIRSADVSFSDSPLTESEPPPAPRSSGVPGKPTNSATYRAYHNAASEMVFVKGSWDQHGPVEVWVRLLFPVLPGQIPSPLQRVGAAADFGNGVSSILPWESYTFINPDLTIHTHRPLVGDWVALRTKTHVSSNGIGFAESEVFDTDGRIGRSVQSLLLDRR